MVVCCAEMLGRGATVPILCYCVGGFSSSNDERQVKVSSKQLTMQLKAEEELHILQTIPGHAGWMYQGSAEGLGLHDMIARQWC